MATFPGRLESEPVRIAPAVERKIRAHPQFKDKEIIKTTLPQQDNLQLLKADGLRFHFYGVEAEDDFTMSLSHATQAIYLSRPVAFAEAFDETEEDELHQRYGRAPVKAEERRNVQAVMEGLPDFAGVNWIIPPKVMLDRILLNHLYSTTEHLLPNEAVWTTDKLVPNRHQDPRNLVAGCFGENGLLVSYIPSDIMGDRAGVFIVGLPEGVIILRHQLHLVQR